MKTVNKKYNYGKPIPQSKKITSAYSINIKQHNRMENERYQTNNNNMEKNNRCHLTKLKKLLPDTTNTIFRKNK